MCCMATKKPLEKPSCNLNLDLFLPGTVRVEVCGRYNPESNMHSGLHDKTNPPPCFQRKLNYQHVQGSGARLA